MENKLITQEQSKIIINSMLKQYSKFKKFRMHYWKDGKLLCFQLDDGNMIKEFIGECFFDDNDATRNFFMPQYSQYVSFGELGIKVCITNLQNALFKVVPTQIQIDNKYKSLIKELKTQGRAKIIEATEMSIKLKILENK